MWELVATLISALRAKYGSPSKAELAEVMLAFIRQEIGVHDVEQSMVLLQRALNAPAVPVVVPDLDIATDLGIYHEEHGWFAGRRNGSPVWSKDPDDADRYRTIGAAEHGLVLHGLRGAPMVSIASIPTKE